MSAVRRSDGVLSGDAIMKLLELAMGQPKTTAQLAKALFALASAAPARTYNTIILLEEIGVLMGASEQVRLAEEAARAPDLRQFIREALLQRYLGLLSGPALGATFQLGDGPDDVRIDRLRLPLRDHGYPYLLLEFGVAMRSSAEERFWRISPASTDAVLQMLSAVSQQPFRSKPFSLEALKGLHANQEAAGRQAEEFVVEFERRRLARHPFVTSIRRISDEDTAAGFDVLSFSTERTLAHDRYIEVKGYVTVESFHWSASEIAAAQYHRDSYWLYLVDRSQTDKQGYEPEMLQDPYAYFILHRPATWLVEPDGLKFTRTS